jgi:aerobic carbon-monoxide dehydrogenase medium subunit
VKLPPFTLYRPSSLEEAFATLEDFGDDAAVYSGGTELFLVMKLGLANYPQLVDLKRIPELQVLAEQNGCLSIGAAVTHRQLESSELVHRLMPALAEMEHRVANIRVRTAGTLGGNLAFSDPHSDPATFLLVAGADLVCRRGESRRTIPIGDFVRGPYETALEPGELLTEIRIPTPEAGVGLAHKKFAIHERPAVTVSCLVRVEHGQVVEARLAVGSVAAVPSRLPEAEAALLGADLEADDLALAQVGVAAADASTPIADANGSVEYKRNLVRVFVRRCCREALARAASSTAQ